MRKELNQVLIKFFVIQVEILEAVELVGDLVQVDFRTRKILCGER
jgi:hypothetical protein